MASIQETLAAAWQHHQAGPYIRLCSSPLVRLFKTVAGIDRVVAIGGYCCPFSLIGAGC